MTGAHEPAPGGPLTLVLGGTRSGKSGVAERIAAATEQPVTYVATLCVGDDHDLASRVALHRARRPAAWRTVEAGLDLPAVLASVTGTVLVDSLGPWVAAAGEGPVDAAGLCVALRARPGATVVVSEEVGSGVHPPTSWGRHFRDALGRVNQEVASVADDVLLVVAGRVLPLLRWPGPATDR